VAARGDAALRDYTKQFDGIAIDELRVSDADIEIARRACDDELLDGMRFAIERITAFAQAQLATLKPLDIEGAWMVTDAGLEHLKGLKSLRRLNPIHTQATDRGRKALRQALPELRISVDAPP
jgi:hypothetical protein